MSGRHSAKMNINWLKNPGPTASTKNLGRGFELQFDLASNGYCFRCTSQDDVLVPKCLLRCRVMRTRSKWWVFHASTAGAFTCTPRSSRLRSANLRSPSRKAGPVGWAMEPSSTTTFLIFPLEWISDKEEQSAELKFNPTCWRKLGDNKSKNRVLMRIWVS